MKDFPLTVKITLVFVIINALIWLVFSIAVAGNFHPALPAEPAIRWGMAIMAFIASGFLVWMSFLLKKRNRIAFYLTLTGFAAISLLAILDEVGIIDIVDLILSLIPLILLIKDRAWYLRSRPA